MKAAKRARNIRRIFKKVFSFLFLTCVLLFTVGWLILHYPQIQRYYYRFTVPSIGTAEIDTYYDLLSKHKTPGKDLVLDLGVKDTETIQVAIDKLKNIMSLGEGAIGLAYHTEEKPPAYIKRENETITVFVSSKIKDRREEINVLAHELSHVYVWRLEPSIFGKCNQEKLVDCASVFLGLGVLTLNGLTDEYTLTPEGGYQTRKKLFGYLKPEQFGYLLARYCAEHGIKDDGVRPFLNPAGWKYFFIGRMYIKKRVLEATVPTQSITVKSLVRKSLETIQKILSNITKGNFSL